MKDCLFCRIIQGEIPSTKLYEDEHTFVFLDIRPVNPGHVLVVPKKHVDEFQDIDETTYLHIMKQVRRLALCLKEVFHPVRVGLVVAGFDVPHAHVHLIPLEKHEDIPSAQPHEPVDPLELERVAAKIRAAL